jgi:hypothetical protein
MPKFATGLLSLLLVTACATPQNVDPSYPGTSVMNRNAVLYEGPEMVAVVTFQQGKYSVAQEWLILGVEMTSPRGSGPTIVRRNDISVYSPDGRRFSMIGQDEFIRALARLRIPMERTLNYLPLLFRVEPSRMPNDRWFYAIGALQVAFDEIPLNSSERFLGPLIFDIPGGVQPGRWRLVFDLEESRPDIPFVIEINQKN